MKIEVHGWIQDNTGTYHKPGSVLTVDADGGEGCISAKQADQLESYKGGTRIAPEKKPAKPAGE